MIQRRTFLATAAASLATPALATPALATDPPTLTAAVDHVQLAPATYPPTELWCFDGQSPGPEIRLRQGQRLRRSLHNKLPQDTAAHWHGIRIDNAMDGVPGLTQAAVAPGARFDYDFAVPDAGTYWYHAHSRSWEQVARGLYGPLIVDEPEALDIDADIPLVLDDWRLGETAALTAGFGAMHDNAHAGRLGNFITVNGTEFGKLTAKAGDRLRLRLINAANARIFTLGAKGLVGWVVALDGMPLEQPQIFDRITLAPAQRADLIVDVLPDAEPPVLYMRERDTAYALVDVALLPGGTRSARPAPLALPPNPIPELIGFDTAPETLVVMEGGAMSGLRSAEYQGELLEMRELAQRGMAWALNGVAGLTETPLITADRMSPQRLRFENRTAFAHGMHLHGHHFRERRANGGFGPWRDTLLVAPNEVRHIAFIADNPGKWLLHCHMLGHQAAGMKTWMHVA